MTETHSGAHRRHEANGQLLKDSAVALAVKATAAREPVSGGGTDTEIAQLVSYALDGALAAMREADPETFLRLRAVESRRGMRALFGSLPKGWSKDPEVRQDYREAVVFQNLTLELSLVIVGAIRRYAKVSNSEGAAG